MKDDKTHTPISGKAQAKPAGDEPKSMQQLSDAELTTMHHIITAEMDNRKLLGSTAASKIARGAADQLVAILAEIKPAEPTVVQMDAIKFALACNAAIAQIGIE